LHRICDIGKGGDWFSSVLAFGELYLLRSVAFLSSLQAFRRGRKEGRKESHISATQGAL
jgi:hypothetical protein